MLETPSQPAARLAPFYQTEFQQINKYATKRALFCSSPPHHEACYNGANAAILLQREKAPYGLNKTSHSPTQLDLNTPFVRLLELDESVLSSLAVYLDMISCSNTCSIPKRATAG